MGKIWETLIAAKRMSSWYPWNILVKGIHLIVIDISSNIHNTD